MRSFKNYTKDAENVASAQGYTQAEETATAEDLTKKIADAYNGKSNKDMLKNILAEAEKSKRAGTLSNEEIEAFYQSFAPMLDSGQRKQLRVIVERLKKL